MTSIDVNCPIPGCGFSTGEFPEVVAVALLTTHATLHSTSHGTYLSGRTTGPNLERPKVESGISIEDWNVFERRWKVFKCGSGIDDNSAPAQLFQCASVTLGDAMLKVDADITTRPTEIVIATMKSLAVIPVAVGVLRAELLELRQKKRRSISYLCNKSERKG